jgi:hypothetical protein
MGSCKSENDYGFVPRASATKILRIAQAEAAYHLKRGHPSALSPAGLGPDYWCLSAFNELVIFLALAFYVKVENVQISTDVIGNKPLSTALWKVGDNEGLRHIAILT